jgi:hypothetical protein
MQDKIQLALTEDEIEILLDALEVDLEGYVEATNAARESNNQDEIATFTEAAERIGSVMTKLRGYLP